MSALHCLHHAIPNVILLKLFDMCFTKGFEEHLGEVGSCRNTYCQYVLVRIYTTVDDRCLVMRRPTMASLCLTKWLIFLMSLFCHVLCRLTITLS